MSIARRILKTATFILDFQMLDYLFCMYRYIVGVDIEDCNCILNLQF